MTALHPRAWVPEPSERLVRTLAADAAAASPDVNERRLRHLVDRNRAIHDRECVNLNPAANTMNPRAEALLASGLGSRPSLGHPGDKYETGLEAIEAIEVLAAELAAEVFDAPYVELRCGSGALANLYAFMAVCAPGDEIVAPPPSIGGHVTHHAAGAAGRYGVRTLAAPIDPERYTVDVDGVAALARERRPRMITVGGSLNLDHHPVGRLREIADSVGAVLLFDAAHLSGLIAGGAWPNPLHDGAHVMTMSAYKSLAGPPCGVLCTTDASIAERVDAIAFPGLTANFDVANTAALAMTLLDWQALGRAYASTMIATAGRLADRLTARRVPVWRRSDGIATASHAFAIDATDRPGAGHGAARGLRAANLLTSAIGLPHDEAAGLRIGVNEAVRWGLDPAGCDELAELFAAAWATDSHEESRRLAARVTDLRASWTEVRFCRPPAVELDG